MVFETSDFEYSIKNDGTAVITRYTKDESSVQIPERIDGYTVTGIGENAFSGCRSLQSIVLPDGITELGNFAFMDCRALRKVKMPKSLQSIGNSAFLYCENLMDAMLNDGIRTIGIAAFKYCRMLQKIRIPEGTVSVGRQAFYGCSIMTRITLPESIESIGEEAFKYVDTSVFEANVVEGSYAASYCKEHFLRCSYEKSKKAPSVQPECSPASQHVLYKFGRFSQTKEGEVRPIEWLVLDRKEDKVLLLSKYALFGMEFALQGTEPAPWEKSTLRAWLNQVFLSVAFNDEERSRILTTLLKPEDRYTTTTIIQGNDTQDKVFLLSIIDAEKYLAADSERKCSPTEYVKSLGIYYNKENGHIEWWLRSMCASRHVINISSQGSIYTEGNSCECKMGVRPALWISAAAFEPEKTYENHESEEERIGSGSDPVIQKTQEMQRKKLQEVLSKAWNFPVNSDKGNLIEFGRYVQNADTASPISWRVLARKDKEMLLLSEFGLECKPYHDTDEAVTWETCSLRKWLNEDFLAAAFSEQERRKILTAVVKRNPGSDASAGSYVQDRIFLLSIQGAEKYLANPAERRGSATAYAVSHGVRVADQFTKNCRWWLRSTGCSEYTASNILYGGTIDTDGLNISFNHCAVRPAMWIRIGDI